MIAIAAGVVVIAAFYSWCGHGVGLRTPARGFLLTGLVLTGLVLGELVLGELVLAASPGRRPAAAA